jgi:hypothetical protein
MKFVLASNRPVIIAVASVCLCIAIWVFFVYTSTPENPQTVHIISHNLSTTNSSAEVDLSHIIRTNGLIAVNSAIFKNSRSLPVYRGKFEKNGSIDLQLRPFGSSHGNITSEDEALAVARKVMEAYGGLPDDAVFTGARTTYSEEYDHVLHKVISRIPEDVTVTFSRNINGLPLEGESNFISITLGTDGELLWLKKVWRNYTYAGDVPIIAVDEAIDKLERRDFVSTNWYSGVRNVTIDSITPAYFAKDAGNSETLTEPVWLMMGDGDLGERYSFTVYARKFASFTASPTIAVPSEEIRFMDGSSSTRRIWDFGDGTNSTDHNPVHSYKRAGHYNVTLTAWNDMGSDTLEKPDYITIHATGNPDRTVDRQEGRQSGVVAI